MPTYEYLCQTCSHRFETWQKMTEEPLTTCPECGGHIRRVLYPAGIVFKGSGFYKTDHGNGALPASKESSEEGKKSEEKSTATSESKPSENTSSTKNTGESKSSTATVAAD